MPIPVHRLAETESTNEEAMARAMAGLALPFWVLTARQTAGRGRSGRTWQSARGNLAASLVTEVGDDLPKAAMLSLVAGTAAAHVLRAAVAEAGVDPGRICLKWPNDILIDRAKAGGILIETSRLPGRDPARLAAVIGIGLNLAEAPPVEGRPVACLADLGIRLGVEDCLERLTAAFEASLAIWTEQDSRQRVVEGWLTYALPLGEPMSVDAGNGPIAGRFAGLDSDGSMCLETNAGPRRFSFGDVTL